MIAGRKVPISPETIQEALEAAATIVDSGWLNAQRKRESHDPTLMHLKSVGTSEQTIRAVKQGVIGGIHPIAQAIVVAEELLDRYKETKSLAYSKSVYLLLSLRDVAQMIGNIPHAADRLSDLQKDHWKAALYELLIAVAYKETIDVWMIPEQSQKTPDLKLGYEPSVYVECKAKLVYEESLRKFRQLWSREALGEITRLLETVAEGLIARVTVDDESRITRAPFLFNLAIANRMERIAQDGIVMELTWLGSDEWQPPEGAPVDPEALWERMFGFNKWTEWHHILPSMGVKLVDSDKRKLTRIRRPQLICVRATWLESTEQNTLQTLKDACRHQFKGHRPGVIHMLVNTDLFELGSAVSFDAIVTLLNRASQKVFKNYSRIGKVIYDIAIPPRGAIYSACVGRVIDSNNQCTLFPSNYVEPLPILLL